MKLYNFFGTTLGFSTDHLPAFKEFDRIYGYFATSGGDPHITSSIAKNGDSFHIKARGGRFSLEYTTKTLHPDIYLSLFSPVIYEIKDYFLIHAGSLSGLIISAPCGFGKTTLTRELLKKGYKLLSDELAPLNIKTGLVRPYPRGMGVLGEKNKEIIDIPKDSIGAPSSPTAVIFLTLEKNQDEETLEIALPHMNTDLFKNIDGVKKVTPIHNRLFPMLRLTLEKGAQVTSKIQEIGIPIIYARKGRTKAPDFNAEPRLEEISPKEGLFELSQNILNAHNSTLLEETFSGSRPRMIFELAGLMGKARFFTLTVGQLSEMVKLICRL